MSEDYYLGKCYLSPEQMSLLEEVSNLLDETKKKTLNSITDNWLCNSIALVINITTLEIKKTKNNLIKFFVN